MSVALGIVALCAAVYVSLITVVAHRFTMPRRRRPEVPSLPLQARFEAVSLTARLDAVPLTAWYGRGRGAAGAVILVHGRDAVRGDELRGSTFDLACDLMDAGLSVLMIDLRGHGESGAARLTFGVHERRDVLGAVDYLLSAGYERGTIGVLGASMGGVSVIGAAAAEPAIGAVISDSAFLDLADVLDRQFTRLTRLPRCFLPGALAVARWLTGVRLLSIDIAGEMSALASRPTLVIHGKGDPFIPVSHAARLAGIAGASLWVTPATRHVGSYGVAPEEYRRRVVGFLRRHLIGRVAAAA